MTLGQRELALLLLLLLLQHLPDSLLRDLNTWAFRSSSRPGPVPVSVRATGHRQAHLRVELEFSTGDVEGRRCCCCCSWSRVSVVMGK